VSRIRPAKCHGRYVYKLASKYSHRRYLFPSGAFKPQHLNKCDETGISDTFQSSTTQTDVEVRKSQKSNNDELCLDVEVGKGDLGERTRAKGGNGLPPGLSRRTITELAEAYSERAYANAQENEGDTRTADLDAWLRQRLADEMVPPEFVEVEFRRIMDQVFQV
jgi:hypothetical protein